MTAYMMSPKVIFTTHVCIAAVYVAVHYMPVIDNPWVSKLIKINIFCKLFVTGRKTLEWQQISFSEDIVEHI